MKIFRFGSCRLSIAQHIEKPYIMNYNYDFTHGTKEILIYLDLFDKILTIDNVPYPSSLMYEPEKFNSNIIRKNLIDSNVVIIEISSLKIVKKGKYSYQSVRAKDNMMNLESVIQTEDDFKKDIEDIQMRINKPIIFVSHLNLDFYDLPGCNGRIQNRQLLDTWIKKYCVHYVLPSTIFENIDYKMICGSDSNHYTPYGFKEITKHLMEKIKSIYPGN